ncbi:hypothetical protein ABG067_000152 [Albugo candida]
MDDATWDRTVEKFDNEFKKYTSNKSSKSARAVTLARTELRNYRTLLWKDNKLKENEIKEGRLTSERKELIEKRIVEIEAALDRFHQDVAKYNQLKAILSFIFLAGFALLGFFQPWTRWFKSDTHDEL